MSANSTAWQKTNSYISKRTFAIGDVHGCAGALKSLLHVVNSTTDEFELIFLGDLIDRGPHNLAVLDQVWSWQHELGEKTILPGNHELMMLTALQLPRSFMSWWAENGGETLLDELGARQDHVEVQAQKVIQALNTKILDIIDAPAGVIRDQYLFVHAGIPPHMTAEQVCEFEWQNMDGNVEQNHPLWVRQAFLSNSEIRPQARMVVHGHTPTRHRQPELHANRINVDGGSCFGGNLCMAELMHDQVRFHTVSGRRPYHG